MSNPNVTVDRHKYVGGSDLPTILGLNAKYGANIFEFAKQKAGIIPNTFNGNQFTKYGQLMEPLIRDYINAINNCNYVEDTIIDTVRGYRGNCDGKDEHADIPLLEVKTYGEVLDVEYYSPQCQFYMETFNLDAVRLVGYKRPSDFYTGIDYELENGDEYFNIEFDENNLVEYVVKRDVNTWAKIEERIIAFKKAVEMLRENKEATEEEFNQVFYGKDLLVLTNKVSNLENELISMKAKDSEYKKLKEELYNLFEERGILSFDTGTMKITKVAPTSYDTVSIDTKKLKEENEEIYNQYKVIKTTNRKGYILITNKEEN